MHFVRAAVEAGPIILQARVPVLAGDDEAALASRVLAEEHRIYPLAVRLICRGADPVSMARQWRSPVRRLPTPPAPLISLPPRRRTEIYMSG